MTVNAPAGLIAIWNNIVPETRTDFLEWHSREHIPERVGVPGFIRGRRLFCVTSQPQYLTLYDVASPWVLTSAPYLARLNAPTPWTQKSVANFRDTERSACRVVTRRGMGSGARIVTARLWVDDGAQRDALLARLSETVQGLFSIASVCSVTIAASDDAATFVTTAEKKIRPPDGRPPECVVLVESFDRSFDANALLARVSRPLALAAGGITPHFDVYDAEFSLGREP